MGILYQKKGQHCCANKTKRYPLHPTAWIGTRCSPLLNLAMLPNPRSNHAHWIPCGWRPLELCSGEDLSLPSLFPALPLFPDRIYTGLQLIYVSPFAVGSGRSLSPAWCGRIPVYDSSCLFLSYHPRQGSLGLQNKLAPHGWSLPSPSFKFPNLYPTFLPLKTTPALLEEAVGSSFASVSCKLGACTWIEC